MLETFGQGLERRVLLGLASGVQRRQRPAVKGVPRAHDHVSARAGPLASQLQGTFVGLGPRVGEEDLSPGAPLPSAHETVEGGRHLRAHDVAEQVRHVEQRAALLGQRLGHRGVGMAERRDRQPGEEVEIPLAVAVPQL